MSRIPKETPWVSLHAASQALTMHRHTLLVSIVSGALKARVRDGKVLVSRQSIERLLAATDDQTPAPEAGDDVVASEDVDQVAA